MSFEKNSDSNSNMGKHSKKVCSNAWKTCEYYDSNDKPESRCKKDSNIGFCIIEKKVSDQIDAHFNEYFEMRGLDNSE